MTAIEFEESKLLFKDEIDIEETKITLEDEDVEFSSQKRMKNMAESPTQDDNFQVIHFRMKKTMLFCLKIF